MDALKIIFELLPTVGVGFAAYLAIRVDLARMTERIIAIREYQSKVEESMRGNLARLDSSVSDAHARINRLTER